MSNQESYFSLLPKDLQGVLLGPNHIIRLQPSLENLETLKIKRVLGNLILDLSLEMTPPGEHWDSDQILELVKRLPAVFPRLKGFDLRYRPVNAAILEQIHQSYPDLEYLGLGDCLDLDDAAVVALSKFINLRHLLLVFDPRVNEILDFVSSRLVRLEALDLGTMLSLNPPLFEMIAEKYPHLKSLSVKSIPNADAFLAILRLHKLEKLSIEQPGPAHILSHELSEAFSERLPHLSYLKFDPNLFEPNHSLTFLSQFQNLRSLVLTSSTEIKFLNSLLHLNNLAFLTNVKTREIETLSTVLPFLKKLYLQYIDSEVTSDKLLALMSSKGELTHLYLDSFQTNSRILDRLSSLEKLEGFGSQFESMSRPTQDLWTAWMNSMKDIKKNFVRTNFSDIDQW